MVDGVRIFGVGPGQLSGEDLRRSGHRQPSELVPLDRVCAAVSWREDGSASERVQQPGTCRREGWLGRRRLECIAVTTNPLSEGRGEGFLFVQTDCDRQIGILLLGNGTATVEAGIEVV